MQKTWFYYNSDNHTKRERKPKCCTCWLYHKQMAHFCSCKCADGVSSSLSTSSMYGGRLSLVARNVSLWQIAIIVHLHFYSKMKCFCWCHRKQTISMHFCNVTELSCFCSSWYSSFLFLFASNLLFRPCYNVKKRAIERKKANTKPACRVSNGKKWA